MRPISLANQDLPVAQKVEGWRLEKVRFCSKSAVRAAVNEAIHESLLLKHTAKFRWIAICDSCFEKGIDLQKILLEEQLFGKSILYRLIDSEDWQSCNVVNFSISDGVYDDGRVTKSNNTFLIDHEEGKISKGFRSYKGGAWYGGTFLEHKRHGAGVFCNPAYNYFGEWSCDKFHGFGTQEIQGMKNTVGDFRNGQLEKPKQMKIWERAKFMFN